MDDLLFSASEHAEAAALTTRFIAEYQATIAARPVHPVVDREAMRALLSSPLPDTPESLDALFAELNSFVVPNATHTAHPRFLSYVMPSPNGILAYAEAVAATLNQNCALAMLAPSATAIELTVVRWLAGIVGMDPTCGGILTSGGSVANLVGLTAARDHALGDAARTDGMQGGGGALTLYASDEVHSCNDKAVMQLGIGTKHLRKIPTDEHLRLRVDLLRERVAQDRRDGFRPFCVIASAGTVTTGAFDPLNAIADFCEQEGLWMHVDGAYGALSALSPRYQSQLSGLGRADSISLDPHKFLFTSFEAGCALVKNAAVLEQSFRVAPSYLAKEVDGDLVNFSDRGPQLSRGFKALKIWWSLRYFGRAAYQATVERVADLAQHMGQIAQESSAFELLAPVTFNCVCFRMAALDDDENRQVLKRLVSSGFAFLGPANVKGRIGMRACFMNLRTTTTDVEAIMGELERLASASRQLTAAV
jgi:aromatic-L-amino-acid/L-tryptophan decarboxylase